MPEMTAFSRFLYTILDATQFDDRHQIFLAYRRLRASIGQDCRIGEKISLPLVSF